MFSILRYNHFIKQVVKSKTQPEPWLHIIFVGNDTKGADPRLLDATVDLAIYIWDTRQVIETGSGKLRTDYSQWSRFVQVAHDNYEPLVGAQIAEPIAAKLEACRKRAAGIEAEGLAPDVVKLAFRKIWLDGKRIIAYRKNCMFTFEEDGTFKSIGSHFDDLRDLTQHFDKVEFIKPEKAIYETMVRTASQYVHDHKNSWDCAHQLNLN